MRLRTYLGLLVAVLGVALASYLSRENAALLQQPFDLGPAGTVPLSTALWLFFLIGFLPAGTWLLVQTLRRDLAQRRERRAAREAESLDATYRRALDFRADGQWGKAASELEAFLAGRPDDFSGLLRYGEVLRHLGRAKEALEVHRKGSVLYPHSVALLYELAADYVVLDQGEVAREIQSRILRDFPGLGLQVIRHRRSEELDNADWLAAARHEEKIVTLLTESGDVEGLVHEQGMRQGLDYQRGVAFLESEQVDEASAIFRALLDKEPRFLPAWIMLGEAELLRGREEEAVQLWRRGYEETGSPVFLQRIEDHFIEDEQPARAIETLRGLIAGAANDLLPRFYLGRLYYRLEMHDDAAKVLGAVEERIASSPTYHFLMARIHERRGEMRRAVDSYLTCLRQLELGNAEYVCGVCHVSYPDWRDRCANCGSWNAIELDFEEERLSAEELGVRELPVWGGHEDSGEFPIPDAPDER